MQLSKPHLWQGREDPYLYKVTVRILQNGKVADESVQPLGLRNIEIKPGKGVWLNGKRYPMYGVTRHQDRWGKGSALSKADHDEDLAMIMDVGATTCLLYTSTHTALLVQNGTLNGSTNGYNFVRVNAL